MCNTFATLWNPSIRKARQIPWPTTTPNLKFMRVGFGYDESCNDYKLLAVMDYTLPPIVSLEEKEAIACYPGYPPIIRLKEEESRAWVYSVKSGSWTTVELPGCRHRRETSESVAFKCGLVWIEGVDTGHKYYHHLVRFDFATEKYRYIPTPYPIKKNVWVVNRLVVIDAGSSLAVWGLAVWGLDSDLVVSLWRMEDGMAWTKMCNVGEGVLQMRGFRNKEMVWEYWTKCPKLKASVYNDGGKVKDGCVEPVEYVDAYVESLVLLN